jgi:hypothetical protein
MFGALVSGWIWSGQDGARRSTGLEGNRWASGQDLGGGGSAPDIHSIDERA